MKGQIIMSQKELDRVKILNHLAEDHLTISEAEELLSISNRQLYRLIAIHREKGDKGLIHKLRGKNSNRGYAETIKEKVISIYRSRYSDYGPTLFCEKLLEYHNLQLSHETVRLWLREAAITTGIRKKRPHRKRRERRSGYGELLQFDGSPHDWFEGRGAECCLLHAVDDATSRVYLRFAPSENSQDAMQIMWEYVQLNGVPRALYTDHGSVFYAEKGVTDFTRAMMELGCKPIFAKSPQAKGRVERGNKTFQDRLIKAMREKRIATIGEANKFLKEEFIEKHNEKFAVNQEAADVHYALTEKKLENIFCYKTTRNVRNDFTITLDGIYIQLLKGETALPAPKQIVEIHKWIDGTLHIQYDDKELEFITLQAKPKGKGKQFVKPRADHPWRGLNKKLKSQGRAK